MAPRSLGLVHDYLLVMRGAERTFGAIADCWPEAPIFTLLYDAAGTEGRFSGRRVVPSYLQRLRVGQNGFRRLLPLFPRAVEHLPVADCDVIVSSSSAFAHGVRPNVAATHISYCHSPFRYSWHERDRATASVPGVLRPAVRGTLARMRSWDVEASRRVTHYITNSELSRHRIREYYGRDATIVHPPVDVDRFSLGQPEDFFLVVCELVHHKRVRTALEAARLTRQPIKVVGAGPESDGLRQEFASSAQFLGRVSDSELAGLYSRAMALVVPNVEEFGIAAVEAQASGRPVLAADGGGARETVVPGETGVLVTPDDVRALAEAMRSTDWASFDSERLHSHAQRFSTTEFQRRFKAEVDRLAGPLRAAAPVSACRHLG